MWPALFAFLGALLGSGLAFVATNRATGVEKTAREREEWGRRFTAALDAVTSADPARIATGQALLLQLVRSDLATEEDRLEARAVLEVIATREGGVGLRLLVDPEDLKAAEVVEDTGGDPGAERGPGGDDQ